MTAGDFWCGYCYRTAVYRQLIFSGRRCRVCISGYRKPPPQNSKGSTYNLVLGTPHAPDNTGFGKTTAVHARTLPCGLHSTACTDSKSVQKSAKVTTQCSRRLSPPLSDMYTEFLWWVKNWVEAYIQQSLGHRTPPLVDSLAAGLRKRTVMSNEMHIRRSNLPITPSVTQSYRPTGVENIYPMHIYLVRLLLTCGQALPGASAAASLLA